jgi:hypothetical protein
MSELYAGFRETQIGRNPACFEGSAEPCHEHESHPRPRVDHSGAAGDRSAVKWVDRRLQRISVGCTHGPKPASSVVGRHPADPWHPHDERPTPTASAAAAGSPGRLGAGGRLSRLGAGGRLSRLGAGGRLSRLGAGGRLSRGGWLRPSAAAGRPAASGRQDPRIAQWTILASASSMMSVAPRSFSAGMRTLMSLLGTTVSTA